MPMKCFLSIFLLLFPLLSFSQNFDGSVKWTYTQLRNGSPIDPDFNIIEKVKDTIVHDRNAVILNRIYINRNDTEGRIDTISERLGWIMSYENDRIYNYSFSRDSFYVLYDFNLIERDTLKTLCDDKYVEFIIDSVRTEMNGGVSRRVQFIGNDITTTMGYNYGGKVVEGIGSTAWIVPQSGFVDPPDGGELICFEQNDNIYPDTANCAIISAIRPVLESEFKIYPNPTTGIIRHAGPPISEVRIFNISGELVFQVDRSFGRIHMSNKPDGIYFMTYSRGRKKFYQKVIKVK